MPLSYELQLGKAGEHLVCADLILQGYSAFLADQGLPYDVLVDDGRRIWRVQVKATSKPIEVSDMLGPMYRFRARAAKGAKRRIDADDLDVLAFVALDQKKIAYLPIERCRTADGKIKTCFDFKSLTLPYRQRVYPNGTARRLYGLHIEDHAHFAPSGDPSTS